MFSALSVREQSTILQRFLDEFSRDISWLFLITRALRPIAEPEKLDIYARYVRKVIEEALFKKTLSL